jgi:aldehyde dehydrogenase (NAD+)
LGNSKVFDKVGVPKGVFNLVNGDGEGVGNPLSEHPKVRIVSSDGFKTTALPAANAAANLSDV